MILGCEVTMVQTGIFIMLVAIFVQLLSITIMLRRK